MLVAGVLESSTIYETNGAFQSINYYFLKFYSSMIFFHKTFLFHINTSS